MYLSSKYPFRTIHNHWNLLTFTVFHHIDTICHAFKIQTIFIYKTIEIGSFEYIDANKRHRNQINRKSNKCQTKVDQSFSFYLVHLNSFCNHHSATNSIKKWLFNRNCQINNFFGMFFSGMYSPIYQFCCFTLE